MAGKKLLVADDSLTIQKVIRLALSNEGYEIQAVSDGNDAIQQISLFRPDAVLIDVSLPGKTAFEVKRAINEHVDLEEVRFILMSSAFEKVDEPQADEVQFHGRLTKPFDPAHLRQVLTETLDQVAARRREPTAMIQRPASEPPSAPTDEDEDEDGDSRRPPISFMPPSSLRSGSDTSNFAVAPPPPIDDWLNQPLTSNEPIVAPPPMPDSGDHQQLWDHEPTLSLEVSQHRAQQLNAAAIAAGAPAAPPSALPRHPGALPGEGTGSITRTPPPPAAASSDSSHGGEPDADIRHLTESTIRMSGLDDFQWSVNEPSLKPPSGLLDSSGANFRIDEAPGPSLSSPGMGVGSIPPFRPENIPIADVRVASEPDEVEAPSLSGLPAPPEEMQSAASPSDFYRDPSDSTKRVTRPLPFTPPTAEPASHPAAASPFAGFAPPPPAGATHAAPEASVVGIASEQIEELLRKELQKLLPDLAERIIKQEIHRMLSEKP